jgi:alpha-galactosidase
VGPTIALVGAGSSVFSLRLTRDLCLSAGLNQATVRLHDIDRDRLSAVHGLCVRYAAETGSNIRFEAHQTRLTALEGADFVVNAALAGGHSQLRAGWSIALEHGYRFGGSLHVMHDEAFWIDYYQLRLFDDLVNDMQAQCPEAWYVQVANPIFAGITMLGRRYPNAKLVGLCHGYAEVFSILEQLQVPSSEATYQLSGVNHFIWLSELRHLGRDYSDRLGAWARGTQDRAAVRRDWWEGLGPKARDLYQRFGAVPIGDTAAPGGGTWGWWYHTDKVIEERWHEDPAGGWDRYFERHAATVREISAAVSDPHTKLIDRFPQEKSQELVVPLIEALSGGEPRDLMVNVPNRTKALPDLAADVAVEVLARVSGEGIAPLPASPLPTMAYAYVLRDRIAPMEVELAAFDRRDRSLLTELVAMDPWSTSLAQAASLVEAILSMPGHQDLSDHYRAPGESVKAP